MKKIICKVEYDTEKSELLAKKTFGNFGDADGYEESLYITADSKYFLYANGGEKSIHPQESITRMSEKKAKEWKENNNL